MRMPRIFLLVLLLGVVGVSVLGCSGAAGVSETEYQALQTKLDAARPAVTDAQGKVTQLQQQLATAQADNGKLQIQVAEAAANQTDSALLTKLQQQYRDSQAQVDSLTAQLADLNDSYNATRAQADVYAARIADLQKQIDELSANTTTTTPLPLTADNIQTALWARINNERAGAGVSHLQPGNNLQGWADQHVQQMAAAHRTTTYTDATVGVQAANMAIGYQSVSELVDAAILYWKISPSWYSSVILATGVNYGAVAVLQSGSVFYISFMASDYP